MRQHPIMLTRRRTRGLGLIDGLVAMAILAFGLLALTRFQTRMLSQSTEAQARLTATQYADELLNTVRVDTDNRGCYELPNPGSCGSEPAKATAADWNARVAAGLPGGSASAAITSVGQRFEMTVSVGWAAREAGDSNHKLEVTTDVTAP